jgi:hypothetical protein
MMENSDFYAKRQLEWALEYREERGSAIPAEMMGIIARFFVNTGIGYAPDGKTPGCVSNWAYSGRKKHDPFSVRYSGDNSALKGAYLDCVGFAGMVSMVATRGMDPPNESSPEMDLRGIMKPGGCYNWAASPRQTGWKFVKNGVPLPGDILVCPKHFAIVLEVNEKGQVFSLVHSSPLNKPHGVGDIYRFQPLFKPLMGIEWGNDAALIPAKERGLVDRGARYLLLRHGA